LGAALRDELDEHMRVRGLMAQWTALTAQFDEYVLDSWVTDNMPSRLKAD